MATPAMNRRVSLSPHTMGHREAHPDGHLSVELGETGHPNDDKRRRLAPDHITLTGGAEPPHNTLTPASRKNSWDVRMSNRARFSVEFCVFRVTAWMTTLLNGASSWEARHKRWSLWYSVNALATATAAALVLFFTLQGLVSLFSNPLAWSQHLVCHTVRRTTHSFDPLGTVFSIQSHYSSIGS